MLTIWFSSCALYELASCASREPFSRGIQRRSYNDRTAPAPTSPPTITNHMQYSLDRIESIFITIDEKLESHEKHDEKIENILARLELLDEKINNVNVKLLNGDDGDGTSLAISAMLTLWDKKISGLEEKLDEMKRQIDKNFDDSLNEPLHVKFCDNEQPASIATIAHQMKELVESFQAKVEQNFLSAGEKLEYLQRYLQTIFDEIIEKNVLKSKNVSAPIRRTERRIANSSGLLINEILTMVKTKLKPDDVEEEEDDNSEKQGGSLTDIVSSFENMKSPNITQTTKTTSASVTRKDGVIFPNVKNKPLKLNNTFLAEKETRDAKVRY